MEKAVVAEKKQSPNKKGGNVVQDRRCIAIKMESWNSRSRVGALVVRLERSFRHSRF
jgi:hypothetical protein